MPQEYIKLLTPTELLSIALIEKEIKNASVLAFFQLVNFERAKVTILVSYDDTLSKSTTRVTPRYTPIGFELT